MGSYTAPRLSPLTSSQRPLLDLTGPTYILPWNQASITVSLRGRTKSSVQRIVPIHRFPSTLQLRRGVQARTRTVPTHGDVTHACTCSAYVDAVTKLNWLQYVASSSSKLFLDLPGTGSNPWRLHFAGEQADWRPLAMILGPSPTTGPLIYIGARPTYGTAAPPSP